MQAKFRIEAIADPEWMEWMWATLEQSCDPFANLQCTHCTDYQLCLENNCPPKAIFHPEKVPKLQKVALTEKWGGCYALEIVQV